MDPVLAKKKIRKCKDMLTAASYGIVILVIWDFIKSAIIVKLNVGDSIETLINPMIIAYIVFALIEVIFCVVVGLFLIKFGRNNKNANVGLLIISIIVLIIGVISFIGSVASLFDPKTYSITNFISIIEDTIFFIFSIQILYSICKIMKLSKILKEHNNGV